MSVVEAQQADQERPEATRSIQLSFVGPSCSTLQSVRMMSGLQTLLAPVVEKEIYLEVRMPQTIYV